jgi:hypothetical protein
VGMQAKYSLAKSALPKNGTWNCNSDYNAKYINILISFDNSAYLEGIQTDGKNA